MIKPLAYLKPLTRSGVITFFEDIYTHASQAALARAMKCSKKHVVYLRNNPEKMSLGDLFNLSEAIGVKWEVVANLVKS